ncbi:ABC-2 type transport system permease protein [Rhodococcus sp. 27YEA15]|uniref:ABC transporter permease n=1 Tax=Rhodococcus sp. 27YEA15 TaxID=3156259 RepID=UPI003C7B054B
MNPTINAIRAGLVRGRIELRQLMTNGTDLIGQFGTPIIALVVLFLLRNKEYGGSELSIAELALPSLIGTVIAFNGIFAIANVLALDREDGTLLRAKSLPNGMIGYFVAKITTAAASVAVQVIVVFALGMLIIGGLSLDGAGAWFTFAWVLVLGLLATLAVGAILGSIIEGSRGSFLLTMPLMALVAISGIFYPITGLPGWLQGVGQVFPVYWVGLGMRSALLPDDAAAIEIGESWRHVETAGVLGVWAILSLMIAPVVLRRMARHESGSSMAQRRDKAMQRAF